MHGWEKNWASKIERARTIIPNLVWLEERRGKCHQLSTFKRWIRSQRSPFSVEKAVEEGRGGGKREPPLLLFQVHSFLHFHLHQLRRRKKGNFGSVTTANQPEKKSYLPSQSKSETVASTFDIRASSKKFSFIFMSYEWTSIIPRLFIVQQIFLTFQVRNIKKGKEHRVSRRRRLVIGTADPPLRPPHLPPAAGLYICGGPLFQIHHLYQKFPHILHRRCASSKKKSVASTPLDPPVREGSLVVPLAGFVGGGQQRAAEGGSSYVLVVWGRGGGEGTYTWFQWSLGGKGRRRNLPSFFFGESLCFVSFVAAAAQSAYYHTVPPSAPQLRNHFFPLLFPPPPQHVCVCEVARLGSWLAWKKEVGPLLACLMRCATK